MRPSELGISGTEVHWHPLVLMGAWLRVDGWYRSGNLAPEPELSRWRLHPEAELRKLGSELRAGAWRPGRWPQVPYPKKGACLRHYVLPTVRDQVAFMAYLVLLGPLLDSRVPNFVFGNRWYRRVAWERRGSKPQWILRPYQLLTSTAYLPYARSHGLFRRVAHWTVARMTGAQIEGGRLQRLRTASGRLRRLRVPSGMDPQGVAAGTRQRPCSPSTGRPSTLSSPILRSVSADCAMP